MIRRVFYVYLVQYVMEHRHADEAPKYDHFVFPFWMSVFEPKQQETDYIVTKVMGFSNMSQLSDQDSAGVLCGGNWRFLGTIHQS